MKAIRIISVFFFALSAYDGKGQMFSIGLHPSKINCGPLVNHIGIHLTADYMVTEKTGAIFNLGYFLPKIYNTSYTLTAMYGASPKYLELQARGKVGGIYAGINSKRYFLNHYASAGYGFYGMLGIGTLAFVYDAKLDTYDEKEYGPYRKYEYEDQRMSCIFLSGGLGFEKQAWVGTLFSECMINYIGDDGIGDGPEVFANGPIALQLNIGYRFILTHDYDPDNAIKNIW